MLLPLFGLLRSFFGGLLPFPHASLSIGERSRLRRALFKLQLLCLETIMQFFFLLITFTSQFILQKLGIAHVLPPLLRNQMVLFAQLFLKVSLRTDSADLRLCCFGFCSFLQQFRFRFCCSCRLNLCLSGALKRLAMRGCSLCPSRVGLSALFQNTRLNFAQSQLVQSYASLDMFCLCVPERYLLGCNACVGLSSCSSSGSEAELRIQARQPALLQIQT